MASVLGNAARLADDSARRIATILTPRFCYVPAFDNRAQAPKRADGSERNKQGRLAPVAKTHLGQVTVCTMWIAEEAGWYAEQERVAVHPGNKLVCTPSQRLRYPDDFVVEKTAEEVPVADASCRPYPSRSRLAVFDNHEIVTVECLRQLSGGPERMSQVWLCSVTGQTDVEIVLKLFQVEFMVWPTARQDYSAEAMAYHQLQGYQGTRLPHSYGMFNLLLPCGDTVVGHVMEYVKTSSSFWDYAAELPTEECKILATCLSRQMKEFHWHDVTHGDLACRNVILVEESTSSDQAYEIVYLDWAQAKRAHSNSDWMTDFMGFGRIISELGWELESHPLQAWFKLGGGQAGADLRTDLYLATKPSDAELEEWQAKMQREGEAVWKSRLESGCTWD